MWIGIFIITHPTAFPSYVSGFQIGQYFSTAFDTLLGAVVETLVTKAAHNLAYLKAVKTFGNANSAA